MTYHYSLIIANQKAFEMRYNNVAHLHQTERLFIHNFRGRIFENAYIFLGAE